MVYSLIVGVLWLIFGWMLCRALIRRRFISRRSTYIWIQFFLALTTVSLMGAAVEQSFDQLFAGHSVTVLVKSAAMIGMFHLYYLSLRDIDIEAEHYHFLAYLGPLTLVGGILYFLLFNNETILSRTGFRHLTVGLRDAVMLIYLVSAFLPSSFRLARREQVGSMKVKHIASIIACVCYVGVAVVNIAVLILYVLKVPNAEAFGAPFVILVYIGLLNFVVILLPHRWLVPLQYPSRLYRWWQIRRLAQQIQTMAEFQRPSLVLSRRELLPDQLELTIYRLLIFILDHYPLIRIRDEGKTLYHEIQAIVQSSHSYSRLITTLSELV